MDAYARGLRDQNLRDDASWAWARWEQSHISLVTCGPQPDPRWEDDQFRTSFAALTSHYWAHDGFCDPPILASMDKLSGIPGVLIHGRWDVSAPLRTAWDLHHAWPGSQLVINVSEGHGGDDMAQSMTQANDAMAEVVSCNNRQHKPTRLRLPQSCGTPPGT